MDIRQEIQSFLARYETTGWLLLLMGAGLILQAILWLVFSAIDNTELYHNIMNALVLPYNLSDLIRQPWSIITYPFFYGGIEFLSILMSGLILWSFGRIHQQLLGNSRTRRLIILAIPIIGILTVMTSAVFPFEPATGMAVLSHRVEAPISVEEPSGSDAAIEEGVSEIQNASSPSNPIKVQVINLLLTGGLMPIVMVLVISCITLVPDYPIQLFLFGQVKILWIGLILLVLEVMWAAFFTPMAIAIMLGALLGFIHIYLLKQGTDITEIIWSYYQDGNSKPKMTVKYGGKPKEYATKKKATKSGKKAEVSEEVIDGILDKISDKGYESLTREEKEILFKASKKGDESQD